MDKSGPLYTDRYSEKKKVENAFQEYKIGYEFGLSENGELMILV